MTRALTTGTDLSLILPEDVGLNADMGAFTPAVQLEAREAAARQPPQPGTFAAIDIPDFPLPAAGPGHDGHRHHHKDKGGKKKPKRDWESRGQPVGAAEEPSSSSQAHEHPDDEGAHESAGGMHGLVSLLGCGVRSSHKARKGGEQESGREQVEEPSEGGRERQQGKEPLVAPTQKDQSTTMPLEVRRFLPLGPVVLSQLTSLVVAVCRSAFSTSRSPTSVSPSSSARVRPSLLLLPFITFTLTPRTDARSARDPLHDVGLPALARPPGHDPPRGVALAARLRRPARHARRAVAARVDDERGDQGPEGEGRPGVQGRHRAPGRVRAAVPQGGQAGVRPPLSRSPSTYVAILMLGSSCAQ